MIEGSRVVCVVPARNEARSIGRVVRTMPPFVDVIAVVDDASTDGTAVRATQEGDPRVVVLRHGLANETNETSGTSGGGRGVGAAIVTGYRHALATVGSPRDVFAVMAGDGQMDPRDLRALARPIARGEADYAKGDRFAASAAEVDRAMPLGRRLGGRVFSLLTSWAIGVPISDSQCGFTAIGRRACAGLDLDSLYPGYGYPNDLLAQLARRRATIVHVPVRAVYAGEASGLSLTHLPRVAYLIARARVRRFPSVS